jgi:hypothetical protein
MIKKNHDIVNSNVVNNLSKYFNIKYLLSVLVLLVYFSAPLYDSYTNKYLDNSLKKSLIVYASVKTLNAGISIIKDSNIKIGVGIEGEVAIGNIVSPIYDLIEKFSNLLIISIWTLSSEKFIYEISHLSIFYILIFIASIFYIYKENNFIKKILIVLICLRIFIPISSIISQYLNKTIFLPQIEQHLKIIKNINEKTNFTNTITETSTQIDTNSNFLKKFSSKFNEFSSSLKNIKKDISYYIGNFNLILDNLLHLSILYFIQFVINIIILPLSIFYFIKELIMMFKEPS